MPLALLCGELIGLTVAALGLWYGFKIRSLRASVMIVAAGLGWTAFCLSVLVPFFRGGRSNVYYSRFESVGGSPTGVLHTLFFDPAAIVEAVTTTSDGRYLFLALFPTAFLAVGTPLLALVALPQLAVNTLSDHWSSTHPRYQYVVPLTAPLIAATIMTIGRFPVRFRTFGAALVLSTALASIVIFPPLPGGENYVFGSQDSAARLSAMRHALDLLPSGVPVTATNRVGSHLAERRHFYAFPVLGDAEWAIVDTGDPWLATVEGDDRIHFDQLLRGLEVRNSWRRVFSEHGIVVYRRSGGP
jgi:hypothetical protein